MYIHTNPRYMYGSSTLIVGIVIIINIQGREELDLFEMICVA